MCRKANSCVLLGDEPSAWSKSVPLPPPAWFDEQALLFRDAAKKAANGERDEAIQILGTMKSYEMRKWFVECGQVSGGHRARKLRVAAPKVSVDELDPTKLTARIENEVFARDSYKCRYCGLRLIAKEVLAAFERAVGTAHFCSGSKRTNEDQHGVVHAFKIVADHIVPRKQGGRTNRDNLVTSCPGCNYGKDRYTIEQLGIDDPRDRPPDNSDWVGLTSLIDGLRSNQLQVREESVSARSWPANRGC